MNEFTLEQIREFWKDQALTHGPSPSASWSDHRVIEMEIREILKRLRTGDQILDIGCANGYSTLQLARQKKISIKGLDYIPEMIDEARTSLSQTKKLSGKVRFGVGDITNLKEKAGSYDKVVVIRVLINLGDWNNQLRAVEECLRVVKKGGVLLFSEATLQGWRQLNRLRREWGLEDIPMPPFNKYIDQDQLIEAISSKAKLVEVVNFASTYYLGTRVLKPLLIKAVKENIDVGDPNMEWNRFFSQLPPAGDYGTQKLFVFRKK